MFGPEHPDWAAQNGQIHRVRELISGCQGLEVGRRGETTNRYEISSCGDKHALELRLEAPFCDYFKNQLTVLLFKYADQLSSM